MSDASAPGTIEKRSILWDQMFLRCSTVAMWLRETLAAARNPAALSSARPMAWPRMSPVPSSMTRKTTWGRPSLRHSDVAERSNRTTVPAS